MFLCCLANAAVDISLFIIDTTIDQNYIICNISGVACTLGSGVLLACLVLYALDRFFKIVFFRDIRIRHFMFLFLSLVGVLLIGITITFTTATHNFTPVISGEWCFLAFVSPDLVVLIPGVLAVIYLGLSIAVILSSYFYIYLYVRRVRRDVKEFEMTTHNEGISYDNSNTKRTGSIQPHSQESSHHPHLHSEYIMPIESAKPPPKVDEAEQEVFRLCVAILAVLLLCWTPMFIVLLMKIIGQRLAPLWAEVAAIYLTTFDFALLTPTVLVRFNKNYRRLWYQHVLPRSLASSRWAVVVFGKV